MSYARFGWSGSDVYVYLDVRGYLCCCACNLGDRWDFHTTNEMIAHLEGHRKAGDCVPQDTIDALLADKAENDRWIANYDPAEETRKSREINQRIVDIWKIAEEELGYIHPGSERFDLAAHSRAWQEATAIYEERVV